MSYRLHCGGQDEPRKAGYGKLGGKQGQASGEAVQWCQKAGWLGRHGQEDQLRPQPGQGLSGSDCRRHFRRREEEPLGSWPSRF